MLLVFGRTIALRKSVVSLVNCLTCVLTAGLNRTVRDALNEGKSDFNRYAESGQVMINRAMHLGKR
jgi:hypothetical protein